MANKERKIWIDWFKMIGMVFIIWGHMFPYHFTDFVYSFSVPAFFWASGYLASTNADIKTFLIKLWSNLVVPYLLICAVNLVLCVLIFHGHYLSVNGVAKSLAAIPLGIQSFPDQTAVGIGALWFVYSLAILKIVHYFTNARILLVLSIIALLIVWLLDPSNSYLAIFSTLLCLPFYTIGVCCREVKASSFNKVMRMPVAVQHVILLVLIVALYFLSSINHAPYLYKLEYGNNILLMLLNATLGILILTLVSKLLELNNKMGETFLPNINAGMIIILGFQRWFVLIMTYIIKPRVSSQIMFDLLSFTASILILLMFIPIIKTFSKHLPAFLGYRKI